MDSRAKNLLALAIISFSFCLIQSCASSSAYQVGMDPKDHGYCAGNEPSKVTDTDDGEEWVKQSCKPADGRCLREYNQLCRTVQRLALGDNTYRKRRNKMSESGPEKRMSFLLENYVVPVLNTYSSLWNTAIENDVSFSSWVNLASGTVTAEGGSMMKKELKSIQKDIKKMKSGKRRELLIEMYSVSEGLVGLVKQPTGSLRDFGRKVRKKKERFDELKSKLEFTKPETASDKSNPEEPDTDESADKNERKGTEPPENATNKE